MQELIADLSIPAPAPRQLAVLESAIAVFARYGYRKASMDEVARAAGVSRQGLYLQFANKEELFRRALAHCLESQLAAAIAVLARHEDSLQVRLTRACDEWAGKFIGSLGADATDLMCASTTLAGGLLSLFEARFEEALAQAIRESPLAGFCARSEVLPADLARALHATARGLKQRCATRQDFVKHVSVAARMFCTPLNQRK